MYGADLTPVIAKAAIELLLLPLLLLVAAELASGCTTSSYSKIAIPPVGGLQPRAIELQLDCRTPRNVGSPSTLGGGGGPLLASSPVEELPPFALELFATDGEMKGGIGGALGAGGFGGGGGGRQSSMPSQTSHSVHRSSVRQCLAWQ